MTQSATPDYNWPGGYNLKWPQDQVEAKMAAVGLTPKVMTLVDSIFRGPTGPRDSRGDFYFRTDPDTGGIQIRIDDPLLAQRIGLPHLTDWT